MSDLRVFNCKSVEDPVHTPHKGETVEIVRPLRVPDEADVEAGPMFEIRFSDGTIGNAFEDELTTTKEEG